MKKLLCLATTLTLAACGAETVGSAATAAALKQQEMEQGKKSMEQFQQKLDQANQQANQQLLQRAAEAEK